MKNKSWDEMYELAKRYYEKNGNLLISSQYVTEAGIKLGYWINHQREYYKDNKLTSEKISLLEKIGMVWAVYDANWFEYYELATKYYNENGNLLISLQFITNEGVKLGAWIGTQRKQYKNGRISKNKVELLEKIGMTWSIYDAQWFEYYYLSVEYNKKNGDSCWCFHPRLTMKNTMFYHTFGYRKKIFP